MQMDDSLPLKQHVKTAELSTVFTQQKPVGLFQKNNVPPTQADFIQVSDELGSSASDSWASHGAAA